MTDNPHQHQHPSSKCKGKRSVRFNDLVTRHKYEVRYPSDTTSLWYKEEEFLSFFIRTNRIAMANRYIIAALKRMPKRADRYRFLEGVQEDVLCIHGIEYLAGSASMQRYLDRKQQQVIQSVLAEQARPERNAINRIAMTSMKHSSALKKRALTIGMYYERHAKRLALQQRS